MCHYRRDLYQTVRHAIINPEYRLRPGPPSSVDPLTHSGACVEPLNLRKDIDIAFEIYLDNQDWLAYASNLLEDTEYTEWPVRLSTSIIWQKSSSFAIIQKYLPGQKIFGPKIQ